MTNLNNLPDPKRKPHTGGRPFVHVELYPEFYERYHEGESLRQIARDKHVAPSTVRRGVLHITEQLELKNK